MTTTPAEFSILSHTLLIGAAQLIPVPFVDEWVVAFLWRHMVTDLGQIHMHRLGRAEVDAIVRSIRPGDSGCLGVLLAPVKEIFRELAFWLEWRRTIHVATQAYYSGILLDEVFSRTDFDPGKAVAYGRAVSQAKQGMNTRLASEVLRRVFLSGRGVMRDLARWLYRLAMHYAGKGIARLWQRRLSAQDVEQLADLFEKERPEVKDLLERLVHSLKEGMGQLPKDHIESLRARLAALLAA